MNFQDEINGRINEIENFLYSFQTDKKWFHYKELEEDLHGILNPTVVLDSFFKERKYMDLNGFYNIYTKEDISRQKELRELYRSNYSHLTHDEFKTHLKARLYRTLLSVLTEYHAFFFFRKFLGQDAVSRDINLDIQGVDFSLKYLDDTYRIHVYVDTERARELRQYKLENKKSNSIAGIHVDLPYSINGKVQTIHLGKKLRGGFFIVTEKYVRYFIDEIKNGNIKKYNIIGINDRFIYDSNQENASDPKSKELYDCKNEDVSDWLGF